MVDDWRERPPGGEPVRSALSGLFTEGLPVDGASISVVGLSGNHSVISSTGPAAAILEQVQFELGEGPHWEALASGRSVLVDDVRAADATRWPAFADRVASLNVGAIFSFPMSLGTAVVGVVDLCRYRSGALSFAETRTAAALTRAVTRSAVHVATDAAATEAEHVNPVGGFPEMRREVHQATGMLVAQLDTSTTNAFATLRAYSFANDRAVEDVAADIVGRRLDLTNPIH